MEPHTTLHAQSSTQGHIIWLTGLPGGKSCGLYYIALQARGCTYLKEVGDVMPKGFQYRWTAGMGLGMSLKSTLASSADIPWKSLTKCLKLIKETKHFRGKSERGEGAGKRQTECDSMWDRGKASVMDYRLAQQEVKNRYKWSISSPGKKSKSDTQGFHTNNLDVSLMIWKSWKNLHVKLNADLCNVMYIGKTS